MRRITTGWRPFPEHHAPGATAQEALGSSRVPIFDVRLLGAIVAALIALTGLTGPESAQESSRSRVGRDEVGLSVTSLAFSPAGDQVATTSAGGRVTLRAFAGRRQLERSLNFPGYARVAAFSPDGRSLAAAGITRGVYLWDLSSSTTHAATALPVPIRRARRMMFSPDSRSLAVTTDLDGTILLWDLTRGRERMVLHHPSPVASMAFAPDGRRLAPGGGTIGRSSYGTFKPALGESCWRMGPAMLWRSPSLPMGLCWHQPTCPNTMFGCGILIRGGSAWSSPDIHALSIRSLFPRTACCWPPPATTGWSGSGRLRRADDGSAWTAERLGSPPSCSPRMVEPSS